MFDVSVIIPVYNVEKYIKICVDSILNQTLKNLEVILVNDCTPDNSMKLCEELYSNNDRVQLINQPKNMGAGEARNTGITKARGKYIAFVDSDDQVFPEMFEAMCDAAKKFNADVVHNTGVVAVVPTEGDVINLDMIDPAKNLPFKVEVDFEPAKEVTLLDDDLSKRLEGWVKHKYHWAIWNQIYKRDFLIENDIKFSKMKFAEDLVFSLTCLFSAKNYVVVPGQWYIYRPSQNSLSRSADTLKGTLKALDSQLRGLETINNSLRKIPFFRDSHENSRIAIEHMLGDLMKGFIRPDYQKFGEEKMLSDKDLHKFFFDEFGEQADYIEFLFFELLKNYPPIFDKMTLFTDPKVWGTIRKNYPKYLETGSFKDLWEGFNVKN